MTDEGAKGLSSEEAARRFAKYGPNRVPEAARHPVLAFVSKLNAPVPWMLEATFGIELFLRRFVESGIVAALLVFNAILAFTQEQRAHGALALLRRRLGVVVRARRNGAWTTLRADQLVPGDCVHLRMGDFVPADMRLHDGDLLLDASSLTGESMPVSAIAGVEIHSGSIVRRGEATGIVTATGAASRYGKTAELVASATSESHLESLVLGVVRALVGVDAALAFVVLAAAIARATAPAEVLPFVLMLLIASVPVALPATFTLASALGAVDLARKGVLVTRLSAIEDAAGMQVLCSDKTGTLTENRLALATVAPFAPFDHDEVVRIAALASDEATQDPLDLAVIRAQGGHNPVFERVRFVPFDPATKRSEAIVKRSGETMRVVKGAPGAIGAMAAETERVRREAAKLAVAGQRVLAVAAGKRDDLRIVGLLGFHDPARADARVLVARLRDLGIRTVILTGDAEATALALSPKLGIAPADVHARVLPEDKLRLVRRFQDEGAVVGMTGDGVNDAAALKQAEVGIAVASATDVAKAAASVVLTTDGLSGVVSAVETGRRIYRRMLTYTLNKIVKTVEVGLFLTIGFVATGTLITTPRLILVLLLTNDFVTMSIARDRVSYSRVPERWNVRDLVGRAAPLALGWLAFSLAVVAFADRRLHMALGPRQTMAFLALVFGGQANVYLAREPRHFWRSKPSGWMLAATASALVVVTLLATTGTLMSAVAPLRIGELALATVVMMLALDTIRAAQHARRGLAR